MVKKIEENSNTSSKENNKITIIIKNETKSLNIDNSIINIEGDLTVNNNFVMTGSGRLNINGDLQAKTIKSTNNINCDDLVGNIESVTGNINCNDLIGDIGTVIGNVICDNRLN